MRRRVLTLLIGLFAALAALAVVFTPRVAQAKNGASTGDPMRLEVPGSADAYYFKPRAKGARPILMYLHGRGGNPAEDCRKWAKVGTQFGWVVCPSGPGDNGAGGRSWASGAADAQRVIDGTVRALRAKYKGKVQRRGNLLIGL